MGYLAFDAHIVEAYVARNHILGLAGIVEVVPYVIGKSEPCLQFGYDSRGGLGLAQIAGSRLFCAHHHVAGLERIQFPLHVEQFLLNDAYPVRKELGGVHSHLILVGNRLLVIDHKEHIQHIPGPLPGQVLKGKAKNRALLFGLADLEAGQQLCGHRGRSALADLYAASVPLLAVDGAGNDDQLAARTIETVPKIHKLDLLTHLHAHLSGILRSHGESPDRLLLAALREYHVHRGAAAVELYLAELHSQLVAHVGIQSPDHLAHKLPGLEFQDLIRNRGLVDQVVVGVQTGRGLVGRRVLDDYGRVCTVYEGRGRIFVGSYASADQYAQHEPVPVAEQIEEKVEQVDRIVLFGILFCHGL